MKKLAKNWIIGIGAGVLVCVGLIALIGIQQAKEIPAICDEEDDEII